MEVKVEKKCSPAASHKCYNRFQPNQATTQLKFNGRCEDIKGFVFDCANRKQADRYNIAIREIAAYVSRTYTYSMEETFGGPSRTRKSTRQPCMWTSKQHHQQQINVSGERKLMSMPS
jgi:hypothetical protein